VQAALRGKSPHGREYFAAAREKEEEGGEETKCRRPLRLRGGGGGGGHLPRRFGVGYGGEQRKEGGRKRRICCRVLKLFRAKPAKGKKKKEELRSEAPQLSIRDSGENRKRKKKEGFPTCLAPNIARRVRKKKKKNELKI